MDYSVQYSLESDGLVNLGSCLQTGILVLPCGSFRRTLRGVEGMGVMVGLRTASGLILLVNEPVMDPELLSFPGIRVVREHAYCGEWAGEIPSLRDLGHLLDSNEHREPIIVDSPQVIRDTVRWMNRSSGRVTEVSTDIGVLFSVGHDEWFLVLARDSDAGLFHYVHVQGQAELAWWFSPAGVVTHWAFDESSDGQQVLRAERRSFSAKP